MYAMMGVVKRARWPADLEEAKAGGFVGGLTATGAPIYRNPCTAQFLAFLPNLLALIRYAFLFITILFFTSSFNKCLHLGSKACSDPVYTRTIRVVSA